MDLTVLKIITTVMAPVVLTNDRNILARRVIQKTVENQNLLALVVVDVMERANLNHDPVVHRPAIVKNDSVFVA
jgi:hypothetical protein